MPHKRIKQAKQYLPANMSEEFSEFFDRFFANASVDDLDAMGPVAVAKVACDHWDYMKERTPEAPVVKVYTKEPAPGDTVLPRTAIDIVNDDMAFLIDSVAAEISRYNRLIDVLIHPVIYFSKKDKKKTPVLADKGDTDSFGESHIHIELHTAMPAATARKLERDLLLVLRDVRLATRDWLLMRDRLLDCQDHIRMLPERYDAEEKEEFLQFLEYLHQDNFTLLGYCEYNYREQAGKPVAQKVKESGLGLLGDGIEPPAITRPDLGMADDLQKTRRKLPPLFISKLNKKSTVHRSVPFDAIAVKKYDKNGKATGECLFVGLFTSVTYSRSIEDIPFLRLKARRAMEMSGFKERSHNYKALRHILEKYPRDELFQIDIYDLLDKTISILRLQERHRIALYMRDDPFGRYVSCLIYIPRDRYDTGLRLKIQNILEQELDGTCSSFDTSIDDSPLARVVCTILIPPDRPCRYDAAQIEILLQEAGQTWDEKLADTLHRMRFDDSVILPMIQKYGTAFPESYCNRYEGKNAVYDIDKIEDVLSSGVMAIDLFQTYECDQACMRLKLYHPDRPVTLSAILPMLENMGMRVLSEIPFEIKPNGGHKIVWIHDFQVDLGEKYNDVDMDEVKHVFEEALGHVWYGEMENDGLNRMILRAGLNWREITILRAYVRYLRQTGYAFGARFIEVALSNHAGISKRIVEFFDLLHNPARQDSKSQNHVPACRRAIEKDMETVPSLDEDRILRSITAIVEATLRTNFYQKDKHGNDKSYLSLKFDSRKIADLPEPKPFREIFVYAPYVEGVHLRGDRIARGGLRWSDRHGDFRTEVLGLMKAQQVKNSLIIPMGAKGGFVVKRPPAGEGKEAFIANGIACYKDFIRGLLDITDNRKGNRIVPPKDVVRRDGDDPYLVVAADKGTATFSDIANGLSEEYGFWLGDAFASGGSAGYDHKKMGITARGAWESVKRHFRELGHDIQSEDFDVTGVGDMGGDVFGNGMLLSRHIRLVGAFNHLHIFCDPDPDPAVSFKERERLFKGVKGWDEYNTKKLSKGGRVFSRSDKSLTLTPEIRKRFNIREKTVSPPVLIRAMLKAQTDLLWFGGIGTYVKATEESNGDVGDKANDSLRVNAAELRARVIGEGANLAITQLGRIEFANRGHRINADFIDNSGGVDSSDHEVNIKILLTDVMERKQYGMTLAKRNKLLESMTEEVAALVLQNNYQQTQAISLMELDAPENLSSHDKFIQDLEKYQGLDRALEGLPDEDVIQKRRGAGKGLNRPELATVQAYAKIILTQDLLDTNIPDQPELQDKLVNYFPSKLRGKYKDEIAGHRLRREIIATKLAVNIINRMGPVFVRRNIVKTGMDCADVVRAFMVVQDIFGLGDLWDRVEALDNKVPAAVQLKALREIGHMIEREVYWMLTRPGVRPDITGDLALLKKGVAQLYRNIENVVTDDHAKRIKKRTASYVKDGIPEDLAAHLALIPVMSVAFDIVRMGKDYKKDITLAAQIYFTLGSRFHFDWLRAQARAMNTDDRWSSEAIGGLIEQFDSCQAGLTVRILNDLSAGALKKSDDVVALWLEDHRNLLEKIEDLIADMRRRTMVDLSMLVIAEQRLRSFYDNR